MVKPNIPTDTGQQIPMPLSPPEGANSGRVSRGRYKGHSKSKQTPTARSPQPQPVLQISSSTTQANERPPQVKPIPLSDIEMRSIDPLFEFVSGLNPITEEELKEETKKLEAKIKKLPFLTLEEFSKKLTADRKLQVYSLRNKNKNPKTQELFYVSSDVPQEKVDWKGL